MAAEVSRRALSPEEREALASPTWRLLLWAIPGVIGRYLLFFLLAMLLMMVTFGTLDTVLRNIPNGPTPHFWQQDPPDFVIWIFVACVWGPVFLVPGYITYRGIRPQVRRHRACRADLLAGEAWVIRVEDPSFVEIVADHEDSFYLLEIGDHRSLLIDGGRVAWDFELFGLPTSEDDFDESRDEDEEIDWSPPPPTPFPNTSFVLHLLPHSGRLLQIEVHGQPAQPGRVLLAKELALPESAKFLVDADRRAIVLEQGLAELVSSRCGPVSA